MKEATNILRKAIKTRKDIYGNDRPTKKTLQKRKNFAPGGHYDEYHLLNSPEHKSRGWAVSAPVSADYWLSAGHSRLFTIPYHPGDESRFAPPGHKDRFGNVNHIKAVELKSNPGYSQYGDPWEEYKGWAKQGLWEDHGHHNVQNISWPKEVHHIVHRTPDNPDQWQVTHMNPHTGSVIGVVPKRDFQDALHSTRSGDALFGKGGDVTHAFVPAHITNVHYHDESK